MQLISPVTSFWGVKKDMHAVAEDHSSLRELIQNSNHTSARALRHRSSQGQCLREGALARRLKIVLTGSLVRMAVSKKSAPTSCTKMMRRTTAPPSRTMARRAATDSLLLTLAEYMVYTCYFLFGCKRPYIPYNIR